MKKKVLLAGGTAPFEGPRVYLEEGEWLVEPPPFSKISLVLDNGELLELSESVRIIGPSHVRAIIEEATNEVHLDARQVNHV